MRRSDPIIIGAGPAGVRAAETLVQRLVDAGNELPVAQIERTLAEVDRAWRQGGELPRGTVDALEARVRAAFAALVPPTL